MDTVRAIAPAKVNLLLAIGQRRDDGYHDVTTVIHALALHDTIQATRIDAGEHVYLLEPCDPAQPLRQIEIEAAPGSGLAVSANTVWAAGIEPIAISDDENLACRAVRELARNLGRMEDEHIRLVIEKGIPHQSGLGGGSADAAAALLAAAKLWDVPAEHEAILRSAQSLGADVAFFLYGGCALLDGRGENFVRALEPRRDVVVIIKPEGGVSSGKAYTTFDQAPTVVPEAQMQEAYVAASAHDVALANNLAPASEQLLPELAEVRAFAQDQPGVTACQLTGSGAGTFLLCKDFATAQAVVSAASMRGWWARATSFAPWGAALLP